ncbi:MAG: ribose 5-phosphate isomerase B [Nitrospirota bacterium]
MFDKVKLMPIYIGSDHAGFDAKKELKPFLEENNFDVTDLGCFTPEPCDYPDIAREVSEKVLEVEGSLGIIICGTGIGMSMAANKLKGIRAAVATSEEMAEASRKHNDANVLAIGSRITGMEDMKKITLKFLQTNFEKDQERHVRRVEKIEPANHNHTAK